MRSECGAHGGGNVLRHLGFSRAITPIPVSLQIFLVRKAQHAYKCVVLPDRSMVVRLRRTAGCLNAPTGAWCSLTVIRLAVKAVSGESQCTYRCVVLPDLRNTILDVLCFPSQCTYRCVVLPDEAGAPVSRR